MRGDSLQDLYAKALALFGLTLLGAAGALVDYWPVSGQMPTVASVMSLPAGLPTVRSNVNWTALNTLFTTRRDAAPVSAGAASNPATGTGTALDALVVSASPASAPPAGSPVPIETPLPASGAAQVADAGLPAYTLNLIPPPDDPDRTDQPGVALMMPSPALQTAQNGDNMFAAAGKTIGKAGAKTGTKIASGFVNVASAFGRMFHK